MTKAETDDLFTAEFKRRDELIDQIVDMYKELTHEQLIKIVTLEKRNEYEGESSAHLEEQAGYIQSDLDDIKAATKAPLPWSNDYGLQMFTDMGEPIQKNVELSFVGRTDPTSYDVSVALLKILVQKHMTELLLTNRDAQWKLEFVYFAEPKKRSEIDTYSFILRATNADTEILLAGNLIGE